MQSVQGEILQLDLKEFSSDPSQVYIDVFVEDTIITYDHDDHGSDMYLVVIMRLDMDWISWEFI